MRSITVSVGTRKAPAARAPPRRIRRRSASRARPNGTRSRMLRRMPALLWAWTATGTAQRAVAVSQAAVANSSGRELLGVDAAVRVDHAAGLEQLDPAGPGPRLPPHRGPDGVGAVHHLADTSPSLRQSQQRQQAHHARRSRSGPRPHGVHARAGHRRSPAGPRSRAAMSRCARSLTVRIVVAPAAIVSRQVPGDVEGRPRPTGRPSTSPGLEVGRARSARCGRARPSVPAVPTRRPRRSTVRASRGRVLRARSSRHNSILPCPRSEPDHRGWLRRRCRRSTWPPTMARGVADIASSLARDRGRCGSASRRPP